MAQTTIQGSFLGDGTVTGVKIGADFISAQTALASGLATTDEIIVSDAGVIKRMDISVLEIAATQITASGTLPALNGAALTALTAANITASGTLPALNGAALTALTAANITASGTLPALNGAALTALTAANITASGTLPVLNGSALTNLDADDLATGTVPVARLGDGNESNSTFLRGDNTWVAVSGTTINTNADNRVMTGSGTANTLNGEADLTYTGNYLYLRGAADDTTSSGIYWGTSADTTLATLEYDTTNGRFQVMVNNTVSVLRLDNSTLFLDRGQIKFPATARPSADANTLDDYEEGDWTPEIWDSGNDDGGDTSYHTQGGRYTKIGNRVFVQCHMHINVMGSITGGARIGGLPFPSHSTADRVHGMSVGYANSLSITAGTSVSAVINPNVSYMTLHNYNLSAGAGPLYISGIGNDGNFTVSGHYEV